METPVHCFSVAGSDQKLKVGASTLYADSSFHHSHMFFRTRGNGALELFH